MVFWLLFRGVGMGAGGAIPPAGTGEILQAQARKLRLSAQSRPIILVANPK